MPNDEEEIIDSTTDTETTENEEMDDQQETENEHQEESVEELKKKLKTLEYKRLHDKKKIEELERGVKNQQPTPKSNSGKNDTFSPFDLIAISKADIDEDTLSEVMEYAKFKKMSISEALKSSVVKATIAEKSENKRIAEATNTSPARRGSSKASDFTLLENAKKGVMPDSDEDIRRLLVLRRAK